MDDDKHLRHVKKTRNYANPGENSNLKFIGYGDFHFPVRGVQAYEQHGSENSRQVNVLNNTNRPANYNPQSGILNNIPRNLFTA